MTVFVGEDFKEMEMCVQHASKASINPAQMLLTQRVNFAVLVLNLIRPPPNAKIVRRVNINILMTIQMRHVNTVAKVMNLINLQQRAVSAHLANTKMKVQKHLSHVKNVPLEPIRHPVGV
jgi:hypothetical protein